MASHNSSTRSKDVEIHKIVILGDGGVGKSGRQHSVTRTGRQGPVSQRPTISLVGC